MSALRARRQSQSPVNSSNKGNRGLREDLFSIPWDVLRRPWPAEQQSQLQQSQPAQTQRPLLLSSGPRSRLRNRARAKNLHQLQLQPLSLPAAHATASGRSSAWSSPEEPAFQQIQRLCQQGRFAAALDVLSQTSLSPKHLFLSLLWECGKAHALSHARQVHAHFAHRDPEFAASMSSYLVADLVKRGALEEASCIFLSLPKRNVFMWTVIISGYTEHGQGLEALEMHQQMLDDGVEPNQYTFVALFKACTKTLDICKAKRLHVIAQESGFTSDVFVGCTLVNTYGKCGSITQAEHVFSGILEHNLISWTSMLTAYAEQGQAETALQLYRQMHEEGFSPDQQTFVTVLQACRSFVTKEEVFGQGHQPIWFVCLEIVRAVHADVRMKRLSSDEFVGTSLVSMYGKCSSMVDAENVFVRLSKPRVVAWNALLSGYVDQGQGERALQLYVKMQEDGVIPNEKTLTIAIQACYTLAHEEASGEKGTVSKDVFFSIGKALHIDAWRTNLAKDLFVGNTLVSMYGRYGRIVEAENVFTHMLVRDNVSWNAMLSAYIEQGQGETALLLYRQMQEGGVQANQNTVAIALLACSALLGNEEYSLDSSQQVKLMSLDIAQALHADARKNGLTSDSFVCNTLASLYGKCGSILLVENIFMDLSKRNVVSWSALLSVYGEQCQEAKALQLYTQMQEEGVNPDEPTMVLALQACGTLLEQSAISQDGQLMLMSRDIGQALHADAKRKGFDSDVFVASTLVNIYGKCGSVGEAENVFNGLYKRNTVLWNAMLSVYVDQENGEKAVVLYKQMQQADIPMSYVTFMCVLQACTEVGSVELCMELHFNIVSAGHDDNLCLTNTLIRAYGSCESMVDVKAIFDGMCQPSPSSWNACIAGYAQQGDSMSSLRVLTEMQLAGATWEDITFLHLLSACSHTGLVDEGLKYFEDMYQCYSVSPDLQHHVAVIDLLGRAGDFQRVSNLLLGMIEEPDLVIWLSLLGVCRTHGNKELALQAFDCAVNSNPKDAAAYVVMSNICADAGSFENALQDLSMWADTE